MTKERLRLIIGENIRKERSARDISVEELAGMLGLTAGFVGLIERGQRGTTPITLFKLADIFNMSLDALFYSEEEAETKLGGRREHRHNVSLKKAASLTSDFSDKEMDFVITMIKSLRTLNRPRAIKGDDGEEEDE